MPGYIEQRDGYGWGVDAGTFGDYVRCNAHGVYFKLQASGNKLQKRIYVDKPVGAPVYVRKVIRVYDIDDGGTVYYTTTGFLNNYSDTATGVAVADDGSTDFVFEGYAITDVLISIYADVADDLAVYLNAESGY